MSSLAIFGHSFGGATAINALAKDKRLKCGICLDAWLFSLGEEAYENIDKPILFINSYSFQWSKNVKRIQRVVSGNKGKFLIVDICIILNTKLLISYEFYDFR